MDNNKKQEVQLKNAKLEELPSIFNLNNKETQMYEQDLEKSKEELLEIGEKELEVNPNLSTDDLAIKLAKIELNKTKKFSFKRKLLKLAIKEMEKKNENNI
ncbi:hypothetical protein P3U62_11410 [Mammaliicoccus vitulinus]|uniref:hypothetical protein n=1 Tax=Mammaliicoccus vitulinus TaxID=71237 RepID=UPI000305467B|nr:hypothetical protein [Mammaliicoccus vitulinus]WQK87640.1 hypothetical protein P3U62_11410 [Mammaliicoccus vitulinus]